MVKEKSGKLYISSGSGILQNGQGNFKYQETKETSENYLILGQNCLAVASIL